MVFWGAPCRQDDHQVCFFMSRCCTFFLSSWFFIRDKSKANTFDGKHLEELTSKSYPGKIQDESHLWPVRLFFGWIPPGNPPVHDFDWNKSCVLKVSKLGILTSKLVLLLSDQMQEWNHSRHPFLTADERMVAEMSRDRKYITTEGFKHALFTTFSEQTKNNNKEPSDDFTPHPSACCYILNTHTY